MNSLSLQHVLVSSYLPEFTVKKVVGHDLRKYREIAVKYFFLIGILVGCAVFFDLFESISNGVLKRAISIFALIIYVGCFYELLDTYLDTLVITDVGLILFQRHNPFSQNTSIIQRPAIESIEHKQVGVFSGILNIGTISLQVEDQRYFFHRISSPAKTIQHILKAKEKATRSHLTENQLPPVPSSGGTPTKDSYIVFVEALGEVMEEYLKKKG